MKIVIRWNCGCGFQTDSLGDAEAHCDDKGHIMHCLGEIRPDSTARAYGRSFTNKRDHAEKRDS